MNLINILEKRYSTKSFDPTKKIASEDVKQLKSLLRMSPSSVNIQPWYFVIADTEAGKQRMAKGVQGPYKFNEAKILNASHVVLFCAKTSINEDYKEQIAESEAQAGRGRDRGATHPGSFAGARDLLCRSVRAGLYR